MKIDAKVLKTYIEKVSLNGMIFTINLDFTKEGVKTYMADYTHALFSFGNLKPEAFVEYEELGQIYIKDVKGFMTYLSSFKDVIEIELVDDFILKMHDKSRTVNAIIGAKNVCDTILENSEKRPNVDNNINMKINKSMLAQSIKDLSWESVMEIIITKTENELIFEIGKTKETDSFKNVITVEEKGEAKVRMGKLLINIYNVLSSEFQFCLGTDVPLKIIEESELMNFEWYLAPLVAND